MAIVQTDPFSQVPIFIKLKFDDTELAVGTAFMYRYDTHLFLVSNWHNFSGRDPQTHEPLADHGGIPNIVSCYLMRDGKFINREWFDIPLRDNDIPLWFEHPSSGSIVDVGVLPLNLQSSFKAIPVNELPLTDMTLRVSHDIFVLGYPLGLVQPMGLPIWKRATVATEPGMSSPSFLIDTATREGMSGSPVILRYRGFYMHGNSKSFGPDDWLGEGDDFVGIYSGRLGTSALEAQLGIVWKRTAIEETIKGKSFAKC
jgi:hypothetical protein